MTSIRLYSYFRSSSAWRVRMALHYKGIEHRIAPVHLLRDGGEQRRPEFSRTNPLGQVPVLEVESGGNVWRLTQSMAILEYLEELHPSRPLLPRELDARAHVRQLSELVNSGIQPLQNLKPNQVLRAQGVDPSPLVRQVIHDGLTAMETLARPSAGRFLVGDTPTFADLFLVPQLFAARRFAVDVTVFPLLCSVEQECEAMAEFLRARPEAQPDWEESAP
ncbi:MAG TPA: maleylacetoacetate isomerase [Polyangiaceae bacterium]|nr:maleylacetoacetate isomerase [Polyangiaceae bacterium]